MNWEYMHVTEGTLAIDRWLMQLNAQGSLGWEVVGILSADRMLGVNSLTALLKRPVAALPVPADGDAGWKPDPSGRHEMRHWDGVRWSEHVSNVGATDLDYPTTKG